MTRQQEEVQKEEQHKKWCVENEWRIRREGDLESDRTGRPRQVWSCQRHWAAASATAAAAAAAAAAASATPGSTTTTKEDTTTSRDAPISFKGIAATTKAAAMEDNTHCNNNTAMVPRQTAPPTGTPPEASEDSEGGGRHRYYAEDGAHAEGSFSLGLGVGGDSNDDGNGSGMDDTMVEGAETGTTPANESTAVASTAVARENAKAKDAVGDPVCCGYQKTPWRARHTRTQRLQS